MAADQSLGMNVRQIPLGSTGVRVSEMVFGGAPIGGLFAPVSDDQAAAALEAGWVPAELLAELATGPVGDD